jgi:4-aminobutyrate aminotransferase-like enzyme
MFDVVDPKNGNAPDFAMAERIRYNALLEGLATIAVKNFIRICPPLIITEAEIDEVFGRLQTAIQRAQDGLPKDLDFSSSSSLAATRGKTAAE